MEEKDLCPLRMSIGNHISNLEDKDDNADLLLPKNVQKHPG